MSRNLNSILEEDRLLRSFYSKSSWEEFLGDHGGVLGRSFAEIFLA
jgi:hypothetical protein